ncbi:DMT family protein [Streptomyces paludis]|uniref:hypothetical protein n=1 Tax=Streptomyces paludis TaxID=2282738 RepID=UPI001E4397B4|nr:hypothetical protein [Streptomyces paludis]
MSGATALAIALSLVSAFAYASAAVAQERLAARTVPGTPLFTLLGRGAWWGAVGLNATGALLHVVALTYGPLTVVQPLGALTLVAAVPLGAHRVGRRVGRGEWRGTAYTLAGLAIILLTAAGSDPAATLGLPQALGVAGVALALVALLSRPGARPGLRHAAASGLISGVASALTQTVTVAATARDVDALPWWQVGAVALVVAAFAAGGLLLSQTAYRGGLGAPLAVLTLANPVAASLIGLTLLGERLQGGAVGVVAALSGAVVAARGVVLLTRATVVVPVPAPPAVPREVLVPEPVAVRVPAQPARRGGLVRQRSRRWGAAAVPVAVAPGVVPALGQLVAERELTVRGGRPSPVRALRARRERRRHSRLGRARGSKDCTYQ